jgi:hypothetical protein
MSRLDDKKYYLFQIILAISNNNITVLKPRDKKTTVTIVPDIESKNMASITLELGFFWYPFLVAYYYKKLICPESPKKITKD